MEFRTSTKFTKLEEVFAKHLYQRIKREGDRDTPVVSSASYKSGKDNLYTQGTNRMLIGSDSLGGARTFYSINHAMDILEIPDDFKQRRVGHRQILKAIMYKRRAFGYKWEWL